MNKFKQICSIDISSLSQKSLDDLQNLSTTTLRKIDKTEDFHFVPKETDALLVSLLVDLDEERIRSLPSLRYVGVYGTSQRRVNLKVCKELNIAVTSIDSYCDFETAEAVILYILMYFRNILDLRPKEPIRSLDGKRLGIVGMGKVGVELARLAKAFGMQISYFSRSRKKELEAELDLKFRDLSDLLQSQDVVSLHTPAGMKILSEQDFKSLSKDSLLINTCPGEVMDFNALEAWLDAGGRAIFDHFARQNLSRTPKNIYFMPNQAYRTEESIQRLQEKFLKNIREFIKR